jgi:hypothetical protein
MGHWRDGGIGNLPGIDERPFEEWTLLEKLHAIADVRKGLLKMFEPDLPDIAQEAFDFIEAVTRVSRLVTRPPPPQWPAHKKRDEEE